MTFESNIELLLRSVRLVDLLVHYGKRVDHVKYMYYSPFRNEDSPSMCVRQKDGIDLWVDYGADLSDDDRRLGRKNHGGSVIDMAMELGNLSKKEAIELLSTLKPGFTLDQLNELNTRRPGSRKAESGIVIDFISDTFKNRSLIDYACEQRCIPIDVLTQYCKEVKYHLKSKPSSSFVKIGFPNTEGGWALRGSRSKISSGSGVSTFNLNGEMTSVPSSKRTFVFEGFFDFLSWVAWNGQSMPKADACVLNSVSNIYRAEEWLKSHQEIAVCFDNDQAGRKALEHVRNMCPDSVIRDCSSIYEGFNDLNEFYIHQRNARKEILKEEKTEPPSKGLKI